MHLRHCEKELSYFRYAMPTYRIPRHCNIIVALSVVHNLIREHDAGDEYFREATDEMNIPSRTKDFGNRARDFSIYPTLHLQNLETGRVFVTKYVTKFGLTCESP